MMTAPEIGNVGVNPRTSSRIGPTAPASWCATVAARVQLRAQGSLADLMEKSGVAGITGIDTRAITRRLRIGGAQRAVITRKIDDPNAAVAMARRSPSMEGQDLAKEVTCAKPYQWTKACGRRLRPRRRCRPCATVWWPNDFGIKRGILRRLRQSACAVMSCQRPRALAMFWT